MRFDYEGPFDRWQWVPRFFTYPFDDGYRWLGIGIGFWIFDIRLWRMSAAP